MNKQRGSALIISLLMLLVMTLLGISSMSTSTMEEKMAANDRNQKVAFQNAELTLVNGEDVILNPDLDWYEDMKTSLKVEGESNRGPRGHDINSNIGYYYAATWQNCNALANNQAGNQACYLYEIISEPPPLEAGGGYGQFNQANVRYGTVNITARSTGNGATVSMVQATSKKLVE